MYSCIACLQKDIPRLVYTSTYNVVFGGQTIENGDESLKYFPLDQVGIIFYNELHCVHLQLKLSDPIMFQHPDVYSRTKAIAEQKVLQVNGLKTKSGHTLRTCALRLAGVYGPGEQRHLPRVVVS